MAEWDVPGYTELRTLGSGGFGDVVLARHDESGTLVAIKYLRQVLLADPEFTRLFRAEAEVLAQVEDPHVVRLYEYVESPDGAAIVMELVDGVSLREILTDQGATTAEAALVVLQGSLLGLAAAHQRGVVHRDYKPENVLVNADGDSKLTDFGIAARAGDSPIPAGTMLYAPPEQFAGSPATPASDVYAATATFYECLAGRPPFTGETAERLLYQHLSQPVPLDPVPEPLRPLVTAGMAKDPQQRPADGTTFVTALNSAAEGAYGPDWAEHGRSHLAEAALLLAALWPSGAAPAVHGSAVQQVNLTHAAGQAGTAGQARHLSPEARHRWHLRHLWHLQHLKNVERRRSLLAASATAAAVVVAAGVALAIANVSSHGLKASNAAAALHLVTLQAPAPTSSSPSPLPSSSSPKPTSSPAAHVPPPVLPAPSSSPAPSQRPVPSPTTSPAPKPTPTQAPSSPAPPPTPILTPHPFTTPTPTPPQVIPSPSPSPTCGDDECCGDDC